MCSFESLPVSSRCPRLPLLVSWLAYTQYTCSTAKAIACLENFPLERNRCRCLRLLLSDKGFGCNNYHTFGLFPVYRNRTLSNTLARSQICVPPIYRVPSPWRYSLSFSILLILASVPLRPFIGHYYQSRVLVKLVLYAAVKAIPTTRYADHMKGVCQAFLTPLDLYLYAIWVIFCLH